MAPMPLTGTIGTSSSLKSEGEAVPHRRTLPEPVVTFHLPTTKRVVIVPPDKPNKRAKQLVRDTQTPSNDTPAAADPELSMEASSVLLQSLRQSRLIHLTAMLPYLSTRHRTSTKYHPAPTGHPYPGGLEPSTTPHSLIHLGRADVRIGPLIFPKTRFGEVRVERVNAGGEDLVAATAPSKTEAATVQNTTKGSPSTNPQHAATKSTPSPKPKVAPTTGGAIQPPPPIDDAVVQAVSKAAQKDPKLQALLHTAANGKATPEELRELARFISHVSESLDREKKKDIPKKAATTSTATASTSASASSSGSAPAPPPASTTLAPTVTAPPATTASSSSATLPSSRPVPTPHQINQPSHAPIITVEFRENPSARFILPLWRGAAVERISTDTERKVKVTALLPAIGSTAALRAAPTVGNASKKKEIPREGGKESTPNAASSSSLKIPTEEQLTATAPEGAETHSVTWTLYGSQDAPLTDSIWQCFGRVKGARTFVDGKEEEVVEEPSSPPIVDYEKYLADLVTKLRSSMSETSFVPQLRLPRDSVMKELSEHLTDKFAPRMQSLISKPVAKLKRGEAGDDDDVELIRESNKRGHKGAGEERKNNKRASMAGSQDAHNRLNSFEGDGSSPSKRQQQHHEGQPVPVKRKRHVAKFNADGTLKLCQACGTNTTPMWRRGPAGKSTLCNACGAKWKVGRLVVPNEGVTAAPGVVDASFNTTVAEEAPERPQSPKQAAVATASRQSTPPASAAAPPPTTTTPSAPASEAETASVPAEANGAAASVP